VGIWKGKPNDHDAAAELVGEVDAFGHLASHHGEDQSAFAGVDGLSVFVEDVFDTGGALGFAEDLVVSVHAP
jgi:hypothetical protein